MFRTWAIAHLTVTDEHGSRLNAGNAFFPESLALLLSEDEHCAFENYLDLRDRCVRELGATTSPLPYGLVGDDQTLFGLLATIRKRPGMYFGNGRAEHVWAVVNGYIDAESEHSVSSPDTARMATFQAWIDERYPFGRGHPWIRVFRLLAINPDRGCDLFFPDFDLFVAGDPPDAPDPAMTKMLDSIQQASQRARGGRS